MVCPGSSNEILTAVRFQAHQTPIVKCSENIWGLLWFSVLHMPGLGKSDWPFGIKDHALIWQSFYREGKTILTWYLCSSFVCSLQLYSDHVFAHSSNGALGLPPGSKFRVFMIHLVQTVGTLPTHLPGTQCC